MSPDKKDVLADLDWRQTANSIHEAWEAYDTVRRIVDVRDFSAQVSTNHVYKVTLSNREVIFAKLSHYGRYQDFVEDHTIINTVSNNLPYRYENFLSRALMKGKEIYTYLHEAQGRLTWVIFYRPVRVKKKLPRRLTMEQIQKMGKEFARLHKTCFEIRNTLDHNSKSMTSDIGELFVYLHTTQGQEEFGDSFHLVNRHAELFIEHVSREPVKELPRIPIFLDWNIGNFSLTPSLRLFSRWDYDWFRIAPRILDFYFFSRIVSDVGDKTYFHYLIDPLLEDRFILFLKAYHSVYPLLPIEVQLFKEAYRFFILNYVIKDGKYFFKDTFATRLRREAIEVYLPNIDRYNPARILRALNL
ncbi:MAG: hypothetical protein HKN87_22340 [Saprospiraceae bacterium]|nr:hypothetical protein [Saprospiraceae bacterium]